MSRLLAQIKLPVAVRVAGGVEPVAAAEDGGGLEPFGVGRNRLESVLKSPVGP
ncbi:MAG: hypothetical protein KKE86_08645 [Planctomycetes bacterium]|nr:hypothetical protein [Planctomycetota bacterium]MBU4399388.1 hypothetical protein [Planctomycetota bacterium]MCG2684622.1 hypothetical protein [Planctomycetales bacterium]